MMTIYTTVDIKNLPKKNFTKKTSEYFNDEYNSEISTLLE